MSQGSADTSSQFLAEEVEHLRGLVKSLSVRVADLKRLVPSLRWCVIH